MVVPFKTIGKLIFIIYIMKIVNYVLVFIAVTAIGMLYDKYNRKFYPDEELNKYKLVKKYLLNEGSEDRPFLWIHTTHDINARDWASFNSRNTKQSNQPYKDLCVETLVKQCGDSFKICLIDDGSFEKLIPDWSIRMDGLSDPIKNRVRILGLTKLLYTYGGMLVPNSTISVKDLKPLYNVSNNKMFSGELINRSDSNDYSRFSPSHKIMGCVKNCRAMKLLSEYLEILISTDNTDQSNFEGNVNRYLRKLINEDKCSLICGKSLGTKNKSNEPILIDNWLEESPVDLGSVYCIILPDDEILKRTKYQWFARLSHLQVLEANTQASKYLIISI
jgi:hypothetical protein